MDASWIIITVWLSRIILLLLIVLSVYSVSIILNRRKFFQAMDFENTFRELMSSGSSDELRNKISSGASVYAEAFKKALPSKQPEQFEKHLSASVLSLRSDWEKGLPILGSLGSTTPFIGLLGTILGIIVAFGELSSGKMDSLKVMFALAEALILTAVGLGVAIPAVIANNYFGRKISLLIRSIESLRDRLVADLYK